MKQVSSFRAQVYDATRRIPKGKVSTYALVARAINCKCARAVAQALRHNPFAPEVPCHRVIATDGTLKGFYGCTDETALGKKRSMLEDEGVLFNDRNVIIDRSLIIQPPPAA